MAVMWAVMVAAEVAGLECNSNVELTGCTEQLSKECERKRKVKHDSKVFWP